MLGVKQESLTYSLTEIYQVILICHVFFKEKRKKERKKKPRLKCIHNSRVTYQNKPGFEKDNYPEMYAC